MPRLGATRSFGGQLSSRALSVFEIKRGDVGEEIRDFAEVNGRAPLSLTIGAAAVVVASLVSNAFLAAAGFLSLFDLLIAGLVFVRRVEVDRGGVTFVYRFHRENGPWANLSPDSDPPFHGMWVIHRRRHHGLSFRRVPIRAHQVTLEQARATLSHPACRVWTISDRVSGKLGLNKQSPSASVAAPDSGTWSRVRPSKLGLDPFIASSLRRMGERVEGG